MPLFYLVGPLLYLYVYGTIKDEFDFNWKNGLHFLPFLIAFLSISKYYTVPWSDKLIIAKGIVDSPDLLLSIKKINVGYHFISLPGRIAMAMIYAVVTLRILIKYHRKKKKKLVLNSKIVKWLYVLTVTVLICTLNYLFLYINFFTHSHLTRDLIGKAYYNYFTVFSYSIIPFIILAFPEVLYGIPKVKRKNSIFLKSKDDFRVQKGIIEVVNPINSAESAEMNELAVLIHNFLINEKPFIDPKFTIDDLAKQLEIPKHHIYYCFSTIFKTKFTTVRSQTRVNYAKELLLNGNLEQLSMEGIWSKTGFSSRTNFFVTFKKFTGKTPLQFVQFKSNK
jgi:AraC-like DNA-binding protein